MSVTRDELYAQVWAEPMTTVAKRHQVSSSFLARVCARLHVPRPPRGYWAKRKVGQRVTQPALPASLPGDELDWSKYGDTDSVARADASEPRVAPPRPLKKRRPADRPARHPLVTAVREYFDAARVGHQGYLKPYKRLLVDVFVTKGTLQRALEVANELFLSFEDHGCRVTLAPRTCYCSRPELDQREEGGNHTYGLDSWRPDRPTVVFLGSIAFGLTLYEMTENVDVRYVDGKWVRASEALAPKRRSYYSRAISTSTSDLPSGRLALRVWCASGWAAWEHHWRESQPDELVRKFNTIRRTLEEAVPALERATEEAQKKAAEERKVWEAQCRERERQEAEGRKAEAIKDSRAQLLAIVDRWALARNLETFFADAESRAQGVGDESRAAVVTRLGRARRLLGGIDPLEHFASWKSPEDRCADFQLSGAPELEHAGENEG